jgi:hypothetical protein
MQNNVFGRKNTYYSLLNTSLGKICRNKMRGKPNQRRQREPAGALVLSVG